MRSEEEGQNLAAEEEPSDLGWRAPCLWVPLLGPSGLREVRGMLDLPSCAPAWGMGRERDRKADREEAAGTWKMG